MSSSLLWRLFIINGVFGVVRNNNNTFQESQDRALQCDSYFGVCASTKSFMDTYSQLCGNHDMSNVGIHHMYPQCIVGYTRPHQQITCDQTKTPNCIVRGLNERPGLWKIWNGNNDIFGSSLQLAWSFIHESCHKKSGSVISHSADIIFLGDSVMSQTAQYFICDLLAAGALGRGTLAVASFNHTVAELILPQSPSSTSNSILRIHNKQFNIPCIHSGNVGHCAGPKISNEMTLGQSPHKEEIAYHFLLGLLRNHSDPGVLQCLNSSSAECYDPSSVPSLSNPLYIIFNYGLHIHIRNSGWATRAMARALLDFTKFLDGAKSTRKTHLLIRETTSQSFWFSRDGNFVWGLDTQKTDGFCCVQPIQDPHQTEWRNSLLQKELSELDPQWRQRIGWIPFFNESIQLADLREEYNYVTRKPDCTHFIYTPFAFSALWMNTKNALHNLVGDRCTLTD